MIQSRNGFCWPLSNCFINTPSNGQYLCYNSTDGAWENTNSSSLFPTSITDPANGDLLVYQNGEWINSTSGGGFVTSVAGTAPIATSGGANVLVSLNNSGVTAGSYTNSNITVNSEGLVTSASNGSTVPTLTSGSTTSPTYLTQTGMSIVGSTSYQAWIQVGNIVHVSGGFQFTTTTTTGPIEPTVVMALPIAPTSNFSANNIHFGPVGLFCSQDSATSGTFAHSGYVYSLNATKDVVIQTELSVNAAATWDCGYSFSYNIS